MYGDVEAWRVYALARGDSAPDDAATADATAALTRATDYIQHNYVQHFLSEFDDTHANVELAAYEAANLELATPGFFHKTFSPDQQKVLTEVKGIKWTPTGTASGSDAARPISTNVEALIGHMVGKDIGFGLRSVGRTE